MEKQKNVKKTTEKSKFFEFSTPHSGLLARNLTLKVCNRRISTPKSTETQKFWPFGDLICYKT